MFAVIHCSSHRKWMHLPPLNLCLLNAGTLMVVLEPSGDSDYSPLELPWNDLGHLTISTSLQILKGTGLILPFLDILETPGVIWSFLLHSSVPCPKGKNLWEWSSPWKVWLGGDRYWMTAVVTNRLPFFKVIFRTSLQWNHSNHHGGSHLILSQHPQPPALQHAGLTGQMNGFVNGSPYSFTYRSDKITSHSHGQTSPDIAKFCNSSLVPQRKIEKQTNKKHNNLPGPEPSAAFQRKSRLCHIFFFPPKIKMCLQYNLLSKIEAFYLSLLQNRDYMETFNLESI